MSIAFFTEMGFEGKVPRNHPNMRTEFAWMCALDADHYNYKNIPNKEYDLGIVIIPKKNPNFDLNILKKYCNKVAVMQEGPHWYFQDYSLDKQIWYYNTLTSADIIFTHNKIDKKYYEGLTNHKDIRGGNFVNWYGGFDSYIVASEHFDKVVAPSMGRKQSGEEQLLTHLPYLNWKEWIHKLNEFKIGIHLMRTHAAGTFALNCAYLGIPCIGYKGLDTQEICHPDLTIKVGNLTKAKKLLGRLKNNSYFYNKMSSQARENYKKYYHENIFNSTFKK